MAATNIQIQRSQPGFAVYRCESQEKSEFQRVSRHPAQCNIFKRQKGLVLCGCVCVIVTHTRIIGWSGNNIIPKPNFVGTMEGDVSSSPL